MWDWVVPVMLAPFVGSFLAVLIRRMPQGRPVVWGRSACEACGVPLRAWDMVPLASHAWLRGQCRDCGARIAAQHWQVELAAVSVAGWAVSVDAAPRAWLDCGLGWTLLALAWIDWKVLRLPDALTLPLVPAGLGAALWLQPTEVMDHAVAAALGYGAFRLLALAYRWLRGRDGLGEGDAKLMAALGAWDGLERLSWVLLGGACGGLLLALWWRGRGQAVEAGTAIPFGPCLALAGWVVWMHTGPV